MTRSTVQRLKGLSRLLTVLIFVSIGSALISSRYKDSYPEKILSALANEPIQIDDRQQDFKLSYRGVEYVVQPLANYEIWGLVVSKNNIRAFDDIYHTGDSVDIKDLCVVWGGNADPALLRKLKIWSEPFSCHFSFSERETGDEFNFSQLSNTHILSDRREVQETVLSVEIGDQIHLAGTLVNYYPEGMSEMTRRSSLIRDDDGNGACEVMLVKKAEILAAPNQLARTVYKSALRILPFLIVFKLIMALFLPYWEMKSRE